MEKIKSRRRKILIFITEILTEKNRRNKQGIEFALIMGRRIFTAVDISEEARGKVSAYIENLRNEFPKIRVGWEKPEKLHLTLKFLGDTGEEQLRKLKEAVEKTAKIISNSRFQKSDFKIHIEGTGVFPSPKKVRILWLGLIDKEGILSKINENLETEGEQLGFEKENRKFKPHLTIGRLREPQVSGDLAEKHLRNKFEPVEFEVSEIVVYESKLHPHGSIYSKVASFPFF